MGMVEKDAIDKDVGDVGNAIDFIRCDVDDVIAGQAAEIADRQELARPEEMQSVLIAGVSSWAMSMTQFSMTAFLKFPSVNA